MDAGTWATRVRNLRANDSGELPGSLRTMSDLAPGDGDPVLVRVDLDIAVKNGNVTDFTRIDAILPTLRALRAQGHRPVLFGHVGRDPKKSALPIGQAFADRLSCGLLFLEDWLDPQTWTALPNVKDSIRAADPDALVVLQNTRKYEIEQFLWDHELTDDLASRLMRAADSIADVISGRFVNDAIAANNFDFSTCVLPWSMHEKYLGGYYSSELPWIRRSQTADAVIISGLKANKLDDLQRIIEYGHPSLVIVGGALAASLYKARATLTGNSVSIGLVESDDSHPAYVSARRLEQAARIVGVCAEKGIDLQLPSDFVLDDGNISEQIPADRVQLDIGPRSREAFRGALRSYADKVGSAGTVFYNGVMGMFEDQRFVAGTRAVIEELNTIHDDGVAVFVGGGEGRLAMERLGDLSRVTHAFTAGGTILKAVARRPLWPLYALQD